MVCPACKKQIQDDSVFCTYCGADVDDEPSVKKISLICSSCGGTLSTDDESTVLVCPYCGAKELIVDDAAVAIERIRSSAHRDIELERIRSAERIAAKQERHAQAAVFRKSAASILLILLLIAAVVIACIMLVNSHVAAGIFSLLTAILAGIAWCMGMQLIRIKHANLHLLTAIVAAVMLIPAFVSCAADSLPTLSWDVVFLREMLPEPASMRCKVYSNNDSELFIDVHGYSEDEYYRYINACKEMGYEAITDEYAYSFHAFNADGYEADIGYDRHRRVMNLRIEAPVKLLPLNWNEHRIAETLPVPRSEQGEFISEHSKRTDVIAGDITQAQFTDYRKQCEELGFIIDAVRDGDRYTAFNEEGYKLELIYTAGSRELEIILEDPMDFTEMSWPDYGIGALLPAPPSERICPESSSDWIYSAYVDGISKEQYSSYIEECIAAGFDRDIGRYGNSFWAKNRSGDSISIEYKGNNIIYISIYGD